MAYSMEGTLLTASIFREGTLSLEEACDTGRAFLLSQ